MGLIEMPNSGWVGNPEKDIHRKHGKAGHSQEGNIQPAGIAAAARVMLACRRAHRTRRRRFAPTIAFDPVGVRWA
jgi:hypothetical protein